MLAFQPPPLYTLSPQSTASHRKADFAVYTCYMTTPLNLLQSVFGYGSFRPPQAEVIDTLMAGRDALVIMPTGGGKSVCYQIPAMLRPGAGVVISPLIALMQDQVAALRQVGVRAGFLNSALSLQQLMDTERALRNEQLDLLYLAPERLTQERTLALLKEVRLSLFAIDEAHCVSRWGHDFREDYLALNLLHETFPEVPRIALTATADGRTRREIISNLALDEARVFLAGFDRPNIRYRISLKDSPRSQLLRFLNNEHAGDSGIVYCLSRRKTEETAGWLTAQGFTALPYHAGLSAGERAANQSRFLKEDGVIVVATIAFGMGIDKPDVRFVAHLDLPKTIEAYYQETGRAGRDGLPADAWMVYGLQDVAKLRQMLEESKGDDRFKRVERIKLNAMLGFCEITTCRRHALLAYFDEKSPERCGNCDNCLDPVETWDGTEAARKALSAVYRTGQRFGVHHLIEVLRGVESQRAAQFRHDRLTVYGVGADLSANEWRSVFRQLVVRGYIKVDADRYGGLALEDKCRDLLRGEERISLRRDLPRKTVKRAAPAAPLPENIEPALWERLREHRLQLAKAQGVPPYVIFHDSTLRAMAAMKPRSLNEFAALPGVGQTKLDKYAEGFLALFEGEEAA